MAASEPDGQLIAELGAGDQERPVRRMIRHPDCGVSDADGAQSLGDPPACGVVFRPEHVEQSSVQSRGIACTHATEVIVPLQRRAAPGANCALAESARERNLAGRAGPIDGKFQFQGVARGINDIDPAARVNFHSPSVL